MSDPGSLCGVCGTSMFCPSPLEASFLKSQTLIWIKNMSNALPGATIHVASADPCAGPEEEKPILKTEGWLHWTARALYNSMYFVATSMSYTAHGAVGHSKGDPAKYNAGYWSPPTANNN